MIRSRGEEPTIVEYLKTPPSRDELKGLLRQMAMAPRDLLRRKGTPYDELGLDDPKWTDDQLIDQNFTAGADAVEYRLRQFQEPHQVCNRRAIELQSLCQLFLRAVVFIEIALERQRLLDRVEILALQVLDDGELGDQAVVRFADADRDRLPTGLNGGAQATLTGDELIPLTHDAHQDRLQHVVLFETLREGSNLRFAEVAPRLIRIVVNLVDIKPQ